MIFFFQDYTLWTKGEHDLEMAHKDSYYSDIVLNVDYMGQIAAIGIYDVGMQPMEISKYPTFFIMLYQKKIYSYIFLNF